MFVFDSLVTWIVFAVSSEGNLILSLDSGNPTQLLLSAIQNHGLYSSRTTWVGKEDEFYVGVIDPSSQQVRGTHFRLTYVLVYHRITDVVLPKYFTLLDHPAFPAPPHQCR
jgi:hypothetical protein